MKLWRGQSQELNYNVMFSPRGVLMLARTVHDVQTIKPHIHSNKPNGIDNEWLSQRQVADFCPGLNMSRSVRYPIVGAALQRSGGTARHDAVAWGYARAASDLGVDIIDNCMVTGIRRDPDGAITGVETSRGFIGTKKVGVVTAGRSSQVMAMAGLRLPIESYPLQALVSEPTKPVLDCVVMSNTVHGYVSQSDKGEPVIGAGSDAYVGYGQAGSAHVTAQAIEAVCELFPQFTRMRMLRNWGGIVDLTP